MKIGTRSVLFGAHQFLIHPLFVAWAWWKLFGFPNDLRLWVAFFVHDLGYIGKPNMDGVEGEEHPELGGRIMGWLFDRGTGGTQWRDFCIYHSRFFAKRNGKQYSRLCVADKLATTLEPVWFYLPRIMLSGEIAEYMNKRGIEEGSKYSSEPLNETEAELLKLKSRLAWHKSMTSYMRRWVYAHKDGGQDTWTPEVKR